MTFVTGAKCQDGVVLIADGKIVYEDSPSEYQDKIFRSSQDSRIIVAGSGSNHMIQKARNNRLSKRMPKRMGSSEVTWDSLD